LRTSKSEIPRSFILSNACSMKLIGGNIIIVHFI
jgi:hypothetical protein